MKQVLKLYGKYIISKPLGLILVLAVCSVATAQLVILSSVSDALISQNILPESIRTIMVFAEKGMSQQDMQKLKTGLNGINGVDKTVYISRKDGLKKMKEWLGSDSPIASGLDANALPDAFAVVLKDSYLPLMEKLAVNIEKLPGIEKTRYNIELATKAAYFLKSFFELSRYIFGLYAMCLGLLIFCTIKLRLSKKDSLLPYREKRLTINLAIIMEGTSYALIAAAAGRYLADIAAGQTILMVPEIRYLVTVQNLRQVLVGIGFSAFFGIVATAFSLKVRE
jgi:cell division protein FtsX